MSSRWKLVCALVMLQRAFSGAPRGWNSWDSFVGAANETALLAVAQYMAANLTTFGWEYVVVDGGWYDGPNGISLDANGRPYPRSDYYPSAADGSGFKHIAAAVHALGLKFGVWTIRGIPRAAVEQKLPIANSSFTADQAARFDRNCSWDADTYGTTAPAAPALAYYASLASWYAAQNIDFVKADCMFPGKETEPYYDDDLIAFTEAMKAVGIEVSLSAGGAVTPFNGSVIAANGYGVMYRITGDLWDVWKGPGWPNPGYPSGIRDKLDKAAEFADLFATAHTSGAYPDLDMLPVGTMFHNQNGTVYGPPSRSMLTADEQTSVMSLWCITGAPLMLGGRLPLDDGDAFTFALLTNEAVWAVQNTTVRRAPVTPAGAPTFAHYAWVSDSGTGSVYAALFNAEDAGATVSVTMQSLGLQSDATYCTKELWTSAKGSATGTLSATLNPHASALVRLYTAPC